MSKIIFLNGSPRIQNSTSSYLMSLIKDQLVGDFTLSEIHIATLTTPNQIEDALKNISSADALLLACPLYVDGLPAHLIAFLEKWELYNESLSQPPCTRLYVLMNNGFIEGEQNHLALDMLTYFCQKANLTWCIGLGIGGGEFMKDSQGMPLQSPIKRSIYNALCLIASELTQPTLSNSPHILKSLKLNKRLFQLMASGFWIQRSYAANRQFIKLNAKPLQVKKDNTRKEQ